MRMTDYTDSGKGAVLVATGLGHDCLEWVAGVGWGQVAAGRGGWGTRSHLGGP